MAGRDLIWERWPRTWIYLVFGWLVATGNGFNIIVLQHSPWLPPFGWGLIWFLWALVVTDTWLSRRRRGSAALPK